MSGAENARRERNFKEERAQFDTAISSSERSRDEVEARYRRAHTWLREGCHEKAATELEKLATRHPNSGRAARSWLDAGRAWEKAKAHKKAQVAYLKCLTSYPQSGGAISAAERWVALRTRSSGTRLDHWQYLLKLNRNRALDEALRYRVARSLEAQSEIKAATAYEELARKYPLPNGTYADEALLRSAQLRRRNGKHKSALTALEVLTDQRSHARFVGSYARPAYTEAWLLRGLILRDDLHQREAAKQAFASLVNVYPDSRLVDDALFELARTSGHASPDACHAFEQLRALRPKSPFLECEAYFCKRGTPAKGHAPPCRFIDSEVPK